MTEKQMTGETEEADRMWIIENGPEAPQEKRDSAWLKPRHLYLISLGGCIGTAYLVGSGRTLARGGPAMTLSAFVIICSVVWVFSTLLLEIAAYIPLHGAAPDFYSTTFLSQSFGFALGWNYWYAYAILIPFEITTATLIIQYWDPPVNDAIFITILMVIIVGLNYLPVASSGEAEFAFSSLKLSLLLGLIILSIVLAAGGGPSGDRVGFRYWHDPGPANTWIIEGNAGLFVSFLGALVSVILPLSFAVEMVATTGGETRRPRKTIPVAAKAFVIRLIVFYVLPILAVTLTCPSNAEELTSGGAGAGASPFVVGIKHAGIKVLDHIVNTVILCSAWSAGNIYMYLASRSIYSLAVAGNAPKIFAKTNRWGVPYFAVTSCAVIALLSYLSVSSSAGVVFNWFVNMINMAAYFSWILCSLSYLRFRKALEFQGIDHKTLPYVSICGKPGAWLCIVFFTVVGLLNGFYTFFPSQWNVSDFMTAYVGTLLFVILYIGHRFTIGRKEPWFIPVGQIDLTGAKAEEEVEGTPAAENGGSTSTTRDYSKYLDSFPSKVWQSMSGKN
ncbi:hypothetical protein ACJ73_03615 [Blastomyces percursus]|uniref:Amino acid permease/ SLC12A domain-containing protein n=1 Tax=Blastomyces percursus TaxID=1658174 RepID=A0A1J9Q975_9EURO|nr:hypothetical protein ACJ73_03615 [Blastomyces percursus]